MKLWIKNNKKYVFKFWLYPQYYFFRSVLDFFSSRLLETKNIIDDVKCRFIIRDEHNVIQASLRGVEWNVF